MFLWRYEMSELVDAKELSARLRVTRATIHAWHRRGWIPCLRAGRRPVLFDLDAVEVALRERAERREVVPRKMQQHQLALTVPSDVV